MLNEKTYLNQTLFDVIIVITERFMLFSCATLRFLVVISKTGKWQVRVLIQIGEVCAVKKINSNMTKILLILSQSRLFKSTLGKDFS